MLKNDPEDLIEDAIDAFKNILKFQTGGKLNKQKYFVRITTRDEKSPLSVSIRGLRAINIDKLVWFKGITIRSSTVRPKLKKATFECMVCGIQFEIVQLTSKIKWPKFCINKRCKAKAQGDFRLISKKSEFIDWQSITIQEVPEDLPSGRIPRSIQAVLMYDLVDCVKPGDRVKVMGIFKSVIATSTQNFNSTLFRSFIEVNFIDSEDKGEEDIELSREDRKKIENLAKEPMIQKKIARSIAPTIYGREDLKMACALSLFAGTRKKKPGGNYKRGDIHVLFVGDPGTGKSEILKSAVEVSPRGLYTSGKGSTAVGLTAAVIKDTETGQMNLEAGAIVLANGGVACIDEFDKMNSADRSALHEAMEQQSYHYNTEILTTNGKKIIIGKFVDNLMEKFKDKIIQGKDCQILSYNNLQLYSTNFHKIYKTNINRVSRHKAPTHFYKITFANGRSITVTPDHPIFVFKDGKIRCIAANKCSVNEFIPIPKFIPNSSKVVKLKNKNHIISLLKSEKFVYPRILSSKLCKLLGYFVSEGFYCVDSYAKFIFINKNKTLIEEFNQLMLSLFSITPIVKNRENKTIILKYRSMELYKWMKENFPEIIKSLKEKRIPAQILGGSSNNAKLFLISAFKCNGHINSTKIYYKTSSKGLSTDYYDLLLKIGIQARIEYDNSKNVYLVYIRKRSIVKFFKEIIKETEHKIKKSKSKLINYSKVRIREIEKEINNLKFIFNRDILWDRIKKIEIIDNEGKNYTPWVYDITVEPNHTFIGQGVILHNTVSIAKAGIVATLKAQTAVIAAANPYSGRYDPYKSPTQNIRLPPSLLSRFDLIFIVIDRPNKADDAQMAEFILRNAMLNYEEEFDEKNDYYAPIPGDLLKKYIKHARRTCFPILSEEAKERIKEFYLELRGEYNAEDAIVSILARNLDALVRLSEAYAKMALRDKVIKDDVEEIIKLFKRYLKDTGYDENTGKIDIDILNVGQSRSMLNKLGRLLDRLKELFDENDGNALEIDSVIQILELEEDFTKDFIENALDELTKDGTLYRPRPDRIKFT